MRKSYFSAAALLLAGTLVTTSCIGSFALFNQLAEWNKTATDSKIVNGILGFVLLPTAYPICAFIDTFVLNTIEFWSGDNPLASNIGKTRNVVGKDGRMYAVKTLQDGYEITSPDGDVMKLVYDKQNDSWSQVSGKDVRELFRFNGKGSIKVTLPSGEQMDVALTEQGLYQVRMAVQEGSFFAFAE